ncbi:MAG: NERD domain-containing protein [Nitratireductor sp.]|jgi:hypothetical protein|nr:NERD domain-containing protein [Nitratireductor sp.]QKS31306.1 MAG: NERD domain-containing protein [Candidatus Accumulibacter similis]
MARMIPTFFEEKTPPGERDVFNMLARAPDDWVAIHSLDLAPWNRGLRTEIDFVLVIPEAGILCIEVKSHEEIAFEDGRWIPNTILRSPFKQAADGRFIFRRRLIELVEGFKAIPVVHMCVFPRARFDLQPNLSVQPWELIDERLFRSVSDAGAFSEALVGRVRAAIAADKQIKPLRNRLSAEAVDRIVASCVPIRRFRPDASEEISRREQEVDRLLREQQKPVLQLADMNSRLVVTGAAGTGKTLIAMELARRKALAGKRVALLCFNQLIGDWIVQQVESIEPRLPNLIAGRAIKVMANLAGIPIPEAPDADYWEVEFPAQFEASLADDDLRAAATFDVLIVDEAQDILSRPVLWSSLKRLVAGGFEHGEFALFGDFSHQVLGMRESMEAELKSLQAIARPTRWMLMENCRNYRIIGETAVRLSGMQGEVYSGFMRTGGHRSYDIAFYSSGDEQLAEAKRVILEFRAGGYKDREIAILTGSARCQKLVDRLCNDGIRVAPAWQTSRRIVQSSVHAFKGMERKAVILTDLEIGAGDSRRDLFYIGMTRATDSLRVLCSTEFQAQLLQWLGLGEKQ